MFFMKNLYFFKCIYTYQLNSYWNLLILSFMNSFMSDYIFLINLYGVYSSELNF